MRVKLPTFLTLSILLLSIFLSGCSKLSIDSPTQAYQQAEVLFEVTIPSKLPDGAKIQLELLDDVTGLAFNPQHLDMIQKDERTFYSKTTLTLHSIVKYRYLISGQSTIIETNSIGEQVRYRLLVVNNPIAVTDVVAAWPDEPYQGVTGNIAGQFYDKTNNTPLPNLLVSAQGMETITASDGSFNLRGLMPGTHLLTVTALDGTINDFQQEAVIAENSVTPVFVGLEKRPLVNVTFEVRLPEDINSISDLKIASTLYSLGNLYADAYAGSTMIGSDLPVMTKDANGVYSLTLQLPAGAYLNYKYTFGDGFWNGELKSDGTFMVREFIVPQNDIIQKDLVRSFKVEGSEPVLINTTVPSETPVEDVVSIQFNPYDWMAPLPMTRVDATHWSFMLYNPQGYFGQTKFRFCRNSICDLTHEIEPQASDQVRSVIPGTAAQTIQTNVEAWQMLSAPKNPTTVITESQGTTSRTDFLTGFEIDPTNAALLRSSESSLYGSIAATGANWTIIQPTWSVAATTLPVIEPIPGKDLLWSDVLSQVQKAKQAGLAVALFPRLRFPEGLEAYWQGATRDPDWWQHWFDSYHRFIIQNADAGNLSGASAIILGDTGVAPSFGSGILPNGMNSNLPSSADNQWRQLITDIRSRYTGPIIGTVDLSIEGTEIPAWFDSVDAVYLIIHPEISSEAASSFATLYAELDAYLQDVIQPIIVKEGKPTLLGLAVPSTSDAYLGCGAYGVNCAEDQSAVGSDANIDLDLQAKVTNAAIMSASAKPFINGFFSRGYQPAGSLQDASFSAHGKLAGDVLWYWYHFLGGKAQ